MSEKPEVPGKIHLKRVSIATNGATLTVVMTAPNLAIAVDQEIDYCWQCNRILAQANISEDK